MGDVEVDVKVMTKIPSSHSDWQRTLNNTSKSVHSTATSLTELAQSNQPFTALCNLSPFNPFFALDPLELEPPPARELPKAPGLPFQARCNLTPANPYILPTMV